MTRQADHVDQLVARLAPVRDDELVDEVQSPRATALLATILEQPVRSSFPGHRIDPWRPRVIVAAAALVLAAVLSAAALSAVSHIRSWLSGGHGPDFPVPASADVVIASGRVGVPWTIVATPSDQGLCLFLVTRTNGGRAGSGGCGYSDIRGDLPAGLRGDPSARCVATPSTVVPCGSLPRHWVDAVSGSGTADPRLERTIVFAAVAEGVARVDLVLADGRALRARVVARPQIHGPLGFYWAQLPMEPREAGRPVTMVIARDARGRVLERRLPPWNGNPRGEPEGRAAPL